jgi:hypothetical protein
MSHGFSFFSKKNRLNQGGIIALAVFQIHTRKLFQIGVKKPLD